MFLFIFIFVKKIFKKNYCLCLIDCAFALLEKEHEGLYIVVERTYKKKYIWMLLKEMFGSLIFLNNNIFSFIGRHFLHSKVLSNSFHYVLTFFVQIFFPFERWWILFCIDYFMESNLNWLLNSFNVNVFTIWCAWHFGK
jgi:hypothetical protein